MSFSGHTDHDRVKFIVQNPGTMATVLYVLALHYLGEEIHNWEPETVAMEFKDELNIDLPPGNHDKLLAVISAISNGGFYRDPMAFYAISQILSGGEDPFDLDDPLLPAEMAWAVAEIKLNDDDEPAFSADVAALVGVVLDEDGFTTPPEILKFAKMPYRYLGSTSESEMGKEQTLTTMHAQVVDDYVKEQALLLYKQLSGLPWQTTGQLSEIASQLLGSGR